MIIILARRRRRYNTIQPLVKLDFRFISSLLRFIPTLGFVYRFAAVDGFGKPGKSAAAAAITLTTQGEMCI